MIIQDQLRRLNLSTQSCFPFFFFYQLKINLSRNKCDLKSHLSTSIPYLRNHILPNFRYALDTWKEKKKISEIKRDHALTAFSKLSSCYQLHL